MDFNRSCLHNAHLFMLHAQLPSALSNGAQTVLGMLFHISSDYDKAIDEFKKAVELRPTDPTLWNKLGATQANSARSADAVSAYRR